MFDLLPLIETRWTAIMTGQLFDDPTGGQTAIRWLPLGIAAKRSRADLKEDYPFLLPFLSTGKSSPGQSLVHVDLVVGLYVNPDRDADGDVDESDDLVTPAIAAMTAVLDGFHSLADDGNYFPYSLESLSWQVGDKEGAHPGPDKYVVAAELVFSQAPIF